jgi:hypothetical protein
MNRLHWIVVSCCAALSAGSIGEATAACTEAESSGTYPHAVTGLKAWESRHNITIADSVKATVLTSFCEASMAFGTASSIDARSVDDKAEEIIADYLDRISNPNEPGRSMSATLRSHFGAQGFSRPELKRYGRLTVVYKQTIDALRVRNSQYGAINALLVDVGPARVEGLRKSTPVCTGNVTIDPAFEAKFTC